MTLMKMFSPLLLVIALAACGKKADAPPPSGSGSGSPTTPTTTPPPAPPIDASQPVAPSIDAASAAVVVDAAEAAADAAVELAVPAPDCVALLPAKVLKGIKKPTVTTIERGCEIAQAGKQFIVVHFGCAPLGTDWFDRAKATLPPVPEMQGNRAIDTRQFGPASPIPCVARAVATIEFGALQTHAEAIREAVKPYFLTTYVPADAATDTK